MLEDITSKSFLDSAFQNAVDWCKHNLSRTLSGYRDYDFSKFSYTINNSLSGIDMGFYDGQPGVIHVSTDIINWLKRREDNLPNQPETDPQSMFVHEFVEYIVDENPEILVSYLPELTFPHMIARDIENINRKERGLKLWI